MVFLLNNYIKALGYKKYDVFNIQALTLYYRMKSIEEILKKKIIKDTFKINEFGKQETQSSGDDKEKEVFFHFPCEYIISDFALFNLF